ncbi:unnamed protein product [Arabis nemorensis]|uniref:Hexosyltransferase n=1 Tax=Arabis nemorensis TaxID=586526 RepID=A0A565BJ34_9BRAS|nr:unnamed protein product [Arabis nemorensis]
MSSILQSVYGDDSIVYLQAYLTLLYGDEFLLGVRVLGKSICDTGSNKTMVALVSDGVSDYYKKPTQVVYLDVDTIVVKNIEDLFKCSKFCANLKHSERLNSGVWLSNHLKLFLII